MPQVQAALQSPASAKPSIMGHTLRDALLQQAQAMQLLDRSLASLEALIAKEPWLR